MGRPRKRVKRTCQQCGAEFEVPECVVRKGCGKFCSTSCATTYRNIHDNPSKNPEVKLKISKNHADVSGDKNPMYGKRGSESPAYVDGRSKYSGSKYRGILLANGIEQKCSMCGSTAKLHVHHVNGDHKDNRLENLIWLCPRCHNNEAHDYERDEFGRFTGSSLRQKVGDACVSD